MNEYVVLLWQNLNKLLQVLYDKVVWELLQ